MRVLICFSVLLVYHRALSLPSPLDVSNFNEDGLEKLRVFKNKNYFQGSEQVFNIYNITINRPSQNATCNEKHQTVKLPDGYTLTPGVGAHKLILTKKNWNQARNHCITEGAHLAVITTEEEEAVIKKLLAAQKIDETLLGFHELFQKDDWVTTLDQPFSSLGYANWREGEPNNLGGVEHCGSYYKDGLNDVPCTKEIAFVCKIIV
ncbi:hemolymph lipopolysaccharide-binding protein-like [Nasonia vitripennis]|uniref:C-type lectin domain-containing protein n=1 Tax=Nasonia vitripennis TaxID=7425 RepID=A0A7M7GCV7_NASVI|nr:hemolymph lipopolysaccharide-binding protein-like [Nasonia vitripennis]